jgi:protein deglycase
MSTVLLPLAQGCEELEAVTISDLLTRAGIEVITAGLDDLPVKASRGIKLIPETSIKNVAEKLFDMVVLPGGLPGADYLRDSHALQTIIKNHAQNKRYLAAICAAPKALLAAGVLTDKTVTCYPGALDGLELQNIELTNNALEIDGNIITSRGPGTAMDFTLALIELLEGKQKRSEVELALVR